VRACACTTTGAVEERIVLDMIHVNELTKRYGERTAVDDLSFTVRPGIVTGFLGPNGAGKSTTMRLILGLDRPTSGEATVNGTSILDHRAPLAEIGVLLDAKAVHPKRSARNHLRALAATTGIPDRRVDEVIELVGLEDVAGQAAGGFSLGMGQRLGIASALLGDPQTVVLDEPVNGLDPEGIRWIRDLLKGLADEGRTVFVSSHLMSEMALVAEHFVIIGGGRLIADLPAAELEAQAVEQSVRVRSPLASSLRDLLAADGVTIRSDEPDVLTVTGLSSEAIGTAAAELGAPLYELVPQKASLEQIFMDLTHDAVEYHGRATTDRTAA
jgi:ABC-2 type transport system ATP-binding protein